MWAPQVEAGVRGMSPGPSTEAFLLRQAQLTRFWGCLALAGLAVAAQFLDRACTVLLGAPLGCQSVLLLAGFLIALERQASTRLGRAELTERGPLGSAFGTLQFINTFYGSDS